MAEEIQALKLSEMGLDVVEFGIDTVSPSQWLEMRQRAVRQQPIRMLACALLEDAFHELSGRIRHQDGWNAALWFADTWGDVSRPPVSFGTTLVLAMPGSEPDGFVSAVIRSMKPGDRRRVLLEGAVRVVALEREAMAESARRRARA